MSKFLNIIILILTFSLPSYSQEYLDSLIRIGLSDREGTFLEIFSQDIQINSITATSSAYLGYHNMNNGNFDSAKYYFDISIGLDDTKSQPFIHRGIATHLINSRATSESCNDFYKAIELGYKLSKEESHWIEDCWKHVDVILEPEGLADSTIIDRLLSVLPGTWTVFQIKDSNTLRKSKSKMDQNVKYYFSLIDYGTSFIDPVWSKTDSLHSEIEIVIAHDNIERKARKNQKKAIREMKENEGYSSQIIKASNSGFFIIFKWTSEYMLERSKNKVVQSIYYKDKDEIIQQLINFPW
jgi:hypothetical protein